MKTYPLLNVPALRCECTPASVHTHTEAHKQQLGNLGTERDGDGSRGCDLANFVLLKSTETHLKLDGSSSSDR